MLLAKSLFICIVLLTTYSIPLPSAVPLKQGEITHTIYNPAVTKIEYVISQLNPSLSQASVTEYATAIITASDQFNTDYIWITALIEQESEFKTEARSNKGAVGLMQILPSTARQFGISKNDLSIPNVNIHTGVRYIAYLMELFNYDVKMATTAYFWGRGNVRNGRYNFNFYEDVRGHYKEIVKLLEGRRRGAGV